MKKLVAFLLALTVVMAAGAAAFASDGWMPDGPVTMIVAYAPGNSTDITAQMLCRYAEKYVGQTITVENIEGGSGSKGWAALADAEPDGLTIGFVNLPNLNSSIANGQGEYDTGDFAAICNHVTETSLIVVRASDDRFGTLDELAEYGRAHSGQGDGQMLRASTNGHRASNHIGAQAFAVSAGFQYIDIPQSGTADELLCLRSKDADFCVVKVADIAGEDADLRILGAFSEQRVPEYPDVPTLGELGYYDQWLGSYRCIAAPAGVSEDVIAFYEETFRLAMRDAGYLQEAGENGVVTDYRDAKTTASLLKQQQRFMEGLAEDFWYDD